MKKLINLFYLFISLLILTNCSKNSMYQKEGNIDFKISYQHYDMKWNFSDKFKVVTSYYNESYIRYIGDNKQICIKRYSNDLTSYISLFFVLDKDNNCIEKRIFYILEHKKDDSTILINSEYDIQYYQNELKTSISDIKLKDNRKTIKGKFSYEIKGISTNIVIEGDFDTQLYEQL